MDTEIVTLALLGRQLQRALDRLDAFEKNIPLQLKTIDTRLELLDNRLDQQDMKFKRIEESLDAIANLLVQVAADTTALRGK